MPPGASNPVVILRGGRVIDPANGRDEIADLACRGGRFVDPGEVRGASSDIDVEGWIVCPGLVDMHVHLREPGGEHKETIASGCAAASAGGFTAVACMPNTAPALDAPDLIQYVRDRAEGVGLCQVWPIAAITHQRRGREVVDFGALRRAGAVAFSDDGCGVDDDEVMLEAGRRAQATDSLLIQHCECSAISAGGVMNAGPIARRLGLPGWDAKAETAMIERDIRLVHLAGFRYHAAHVSTCGGVELIRQAKRDRLPVTAEVCPHHLLLTDESCATMDPNTKMNPPLRTAEDVAACVEGVIDGTLDCLVTDHAPHTVEEKARGFLRAPFGIVGLETALPLFVRALVEPGHFGWIELLDRMCLKPRVVLGLRPQAVPHPDAGLLENDAPADITIIDPEAAWTIDPNRFRSQGRNTPFSGWSVTSQVMATIVGGRATFVHERARSRFAGLIEPPNSFGGSSMARAPHDASAFHPDRRPE